MAASAAALAAALRVAAKGSWVMDPSNEAWTTVWADFAATTAGLRASAEALLHRMLEVQR
jgi:hypothetical protein